MATPADTPTERRPRKRWRWLRRSLLALLVVILVLPLAAFGLLQTGWGQRQGIAFANGILADSGLALRVDGISGLVPFAMTIAAIRVDDAEGTAIAADDLHLEIAAGDLFAGQVTVEELTASRIAVARAPLTLPPAEPSPPSEPAWPSLPVDLAVDRLDIDRVELGAALTGEDIALSVDGDLALGEAAGTATLTVERLDGRPARVVMTAAVDPVAGTLALDLVAEEPEGGVVPRMAGWAYDGPWRLAVQGDGPLEQWQGTLTMHAADRTLADLRFGGALDPDAPRLALAGTVTPPAELLPPGIAPEPIAIDLSTGLSDEALSVTGTVDGRGLAVRIDATASLAAPITVDATVALETADLTRALAGLDLPLAGDLRLDVVADGPLDDLSGSIRVDAGHLDAFGWQADALSLATTFAGAPVTPSGSGTLALSLQAPRSADVDLAPFAIDAVDLATSFDLQPDGRLTVDNLTLGAGPHRIAGNAAMDLDGGPIGFDISVTTDAALGLAMAGFEQAAGTVTAALAGAFDPEAGLGWIETTLRGDGLQFGDPLLDGAVGPAATVIASSQIDVARGLQGLNATVDLAQLELEVAGDLSFDPQDDSAAPLGFSIQVASLAPFAGPLGFAPEALAGALAVSGSVGAPLSDAPRATIDIAGEGLVVAGEELGAVSATLAAVPADGERVLASLQAAIDGGYGPVTSNLEATVAPAEARAELSAIDITALGATVTGTLDVDWAELALDGTLDVAMSRLSALQPFTGTPLSGAASARIALSHEEGSQNVQVRLNGRALAIPDAAEIASLTADLSATDLLGDLRLSGTARAETVTTEAVRVDRATVQASGTLDTLNLALTASGEGLMLPEPTPLSVDTDAVIALGGEALTLRFDSLDARIADETVALAQPATIRLGGPAIAATGLDISLLGGRIAGDVRLAPGSVDVAIEAGALDLQRAFALAGVRGYAAQIDRLAIDLSGTGARPSGTVSLEVASVALGSDDAAAAALADAGLAATATLREGMVDLRAELRNVTAQPVTFTLANAVQLSLAPFVAETDHGQPLDGRLLAQTDLQALNPFVAPTGNILLTGQADVDIAIGGVGGAPTLSGDGVIRNATVEVIDTGLNLVNLNAEIAGEPARLTLRRLSASDLQGGSISATGHVDFAGSPPAVEIESTLNGLRAFDTDYAEIDVSGTVAVSGPLSGPGITGDVTVRPAEIRFAEFSTSNYVEVDAIDVNGESQLVEEPAEPTAPIVLPLDVAVRIPNAFYVRGYGLDSEWRGNLQVTGDTAAPVVVGELQVIRGTVGLAGQDVEIGRGIVTFTGATPPDPLVDIEATTVTQDISVTISISGPASTADVEMASVPNLPQEEILSRLLFGVGSGGLSGNQAVQAGRALALISGSESDLGLVNALRSITGITGLTIEADADAEGNPAGRVGGYLDEDVYLSVTRGSATGSGEAEITYEVFDGIDLQSTVTESGDSEVGINFEWDY